MQEAGNVEVVIKHLNTSHQNSESCPLIKAKNIFKIFCRHQYFDTLNHYTLLMEQSLSCLAEWMESVKSLL
jgi:hypothetical protein